MKEINISLLLKTINSNDKYIDTYKIKISKEIIGGFLYKKEIFKNNNFDFRIRKVSSDHKTTYLIFNVHEKELFTLKTNQNNYLDIFHRIGLNLYHILFLNMSYEDADKNAIKKIGTYKIFMEDTD